MATIDQLSQADSLGDGDLLPIFQQANSDTRSVTVGILAAKVGDMIQGDPDQSIYSLAMAGDSFTASAYPAVAGNSVWLQLNPPGAAASATINLPDAANRAHGQEVLITCTNVIISLTTNGSGASVNGAPSSLVANGFYRMRYDSVANGWFRVG